MTAGLAAAAGISGQFSVSATLGQEPDKTNVDDPASFTHRFATVNGIGMHCVEEGKGHIAPRLPLPLVSVAASDQGFGGRQLSRGRPRPTRLWSDRPEEINAIILKFL